MALSGRSLAGPPKDFAYLLRSRRGYLGTSGDDSNPRVLPVCFTWASDAIWLAVDAKPKTDKKLQRIADIQANSNVCFTVDHWDEDWSRLAWLQARGTAKILKPGPETDKAAQALQSKYHQYAQIPLTGPVVRIDVERWVSWRSSAD